MQQSGPDDGIVWRQVPGTDMLSVDIPTFLTHWGGVATIAVVAAIAVTTIIVSTRWAIRSIVRSAKDAVDSVDRIPLSGPARSEVTTSGLGRVPFSASLQVLSLSRQGDMDPDATRRAIGVVEERRDSDGVWIVSSDDETLLVAGDSNALSSLRGSMLAEGWASTDAGSRMTLGQASLVAERQAFENAVASLRTVRFAIGATSDASAVVESVEIETVSLPPFQGDGELTKKVTLRWRMADGDEA